MVETQTASSASNPPALFVTGVDTNVGKTYVASGLVRWLSMRDVRVGAHKPVCSGAEFRDGVAYWADAESLRAACGSAPPLDWICPQRFLAPLAPPVAARSEHRTIDLDQLERSWEVWREAADVLVVEGVGGWLCPLSDTETVRDWALRRGWPVLVVAANRLGVVNHTLLTLESIRAAGLPIVGVVLNDVTPGGDESMNSNLALLREWAPGVIVTPHPHAARWDEQGPPSELAEAISKLF